MITLNDLTVKQVMDIKNITTEDEMEKALELVSIIYKCNADELPYNDFMKKLKDINLTKPVDNFGTRSKYVINGTTYKLDKSMSISTAQYVDYINYQKNGDIIKTLSVFLIPKGHTYNDGYDLLKVMKDIESLPFKEANAIAFFFLKRLVIFIKLFLPYLIRKMKKVNPTVAKQMKEFTTILLNSLESYPTF